MTAMRLKRYPSSSGGFALGKIGVGATMLKQGKTARDYVQSGLVAMWDGIENAGWGVHDSAANLWTDLIAGATLSRWSGEATWGENCLQKPATTAQVYDRARNADGIISAMNDATGFSVEYCCERSGANSGYEWIFSTTLFLLQVPNSQNLIYYTNNNTTIVNQQTVNFAGAHTAALTCVKATGATAFLDGSSVGGVQTPSTATMNKLEFRNTGTARKIYAIRLYSRALTADEIARNYAIDKERFNLP